MGRIVSTDGRLCSLCHAIPFHIAATQANAFEDFLHQPEIGDLRRSAQDCMLCSFFAQGLGPNRARGTPIWLGIAADESLICAHSKDHKALAHKDSGGPYHCGICVREGDPLAPFIKNRLVEENPLSPAPVSQIHRWIQDCDDNHQSCASITKQEQSMPSRVVDVGLAKGLETDSPSSIKLVETGNKKGLYIILSYCWGNSLTVTSTTETVDSHKQDINYDSLPKTMQDAISLTRQLGISYIWIDALCIIQDDKTDWQREAAKMGQYYSKAYLTIAASNAKDTSVGLYSPRISRQYFPVNCMTDTGKPSTVYIYDRVRPSWNKSPDPGDPMMEPLRDEPLSKRCWTLQERLLSPRILSFASEQMHWQCKSCITSEDRDPFYGQVPFSLDDVVKDLQAGVYRSWWNKLNGWYRLINSYTSRDMTVGTDKLPALSGLIGTLEEMSNAKCHAGLWLNRDVEDLCWQVDHTSKPVSRPTEWRAPCWSFASLDGTIVYKTWDHENKYATLLDIHVQPAGTDPHGELISGYLKLKAPIFQLHSFEMLDAVKKEATATVLDAPVNTTSFAVKIFFDVTPESACSALWIDKDGGLAVVPTGSAEGQFRRVGLLRAFYGRTENSFRPIYFDVELLDFTICTLV